MLSKEGANSTRGQARENLRFSNIIQNSRHSRLLLFSNYPHLIFNLILLFQTLIRITNSKSPQKTIIVFEGIVKVITKCII